MAGASPVILAHFHGILAQLPYSFSLVLQVINQGREQREGRDSRARARTHTHTHTHATGTEEDDAAGEGKNQRGRI